MTILWLLYCTTILVTHKNCLLDEELSHYFHLLNNINFSDMRVDNEEVSLGRFDRSTISANVSCHTQCYSFRCNKSNFELPGPPRQVQGTNST